MSGPYHAGVLRVAVLVNRYPSVSHTFIRREIAALEAHGVDVLRVSIRREEETSLADPDDVAERARTLALLERGGLNLLAAPALVLLCNPGAALRGLREALVLGWRSDRGVLRHLAYLAEACLLRRELAARAIGHVHAHFGTNSAAVALLCHAVGGPPFSFTAHGTESFDQPEAVKLRHKLARARFAVAVCDYGRAQLERVQTPARSSRIHVIRCGLGDDYLQAEPTPVPSGPRLVCVARLSPEKGLLVLLDAARLLVADGREFELVLVGDGDLRAAIETKVETLGLGARVRLAGSLGADGVRAEIRAARALVLPSFAEGLPVVLMEAFALGRPVVATSVGGIGELVEPGANGWLVPPGSASALAAALREVLDASPERLAELGRHGRKCVLTHHDAHREAGKLAALIAEHA